MNTFLPRPPLSLIFATQALLFVLFVVGLGGMSLLPGFSATLAIAFPEYAGLRGPLLVLGTVFMVVGLIAVAVVALLVHRIYTGCVLERRSLVWVDMLVGAFVFAAVLVVVGFVVISIGQAGSLFLAIIQALTCLSFVVVACVTLVLRALLNSAIGMRVELDEVV